MEQIPETTSEQPPVKTFAWYDVWLTALISPNVGRYRLLATDPEATATKALLWVFVAFLISGLVSLFQIMARGSLTIPGLSEISQSLPSRGLLVVILFLVVPVGGLLAFAISTGVFHLIAKLLGGRGTYQKLLYLFAAFSTPLIVINSLLGLVPYLGGCLLAAIGFYQIYLEVLAVDAVHQFGTGKAAATILIPVVLVACLAAIGVATLGFAALEALMQLQPTLAP